MYLSYNAPHHRFSPQGWFEKVKAREAGISDKRAKLVALIEHWMTASGRSSTPKEKRAVRKHAHDISSNGGQVNVGGTNEAIAAENKTCTRAA